MKADVTTVLRAVAAVESGLLEVAGERVRLVPTGALLTPVVKPHLTTATAGLLPKQLADVREPLVVTEHATPGLCRMLRELKIPFVDSAGNAWLNTPGCLICIEGRNPPERLGRPSPSRLFQGAGMRLLLVLLDDPLAIRRTYRELAARAGISLGSVSHAMEELAQAGHLLTDGDKQLVRREALLRTWCERYREALRDRAPRERYRAGLAIDEDALPDERACWGGEVAAAKLLGGFTPGRWTVYRSAPVPELVARWRLQPAADGEVELIDAFWPWHDSAPLAPYVVIYADLVTSGSSRTVELAEPLRARFLRHLEEP